MNLFEQFRTRNLFVYQRLLLCTLIVTLSHITELTNITVMLDQMQATDTGWQAMCIIGIVSTVNGPLFN